MRNASIGAPEGQSADGRFEVSKTAPHRQRGEREMRRSFPEQGSG
jgi:hypothetical protein